MTRRVSEPPAGAMLSHFTRADKRRSALDNLICVLRDGVIRGAARMVRTGRPVVCLFDAPLAELVNLLDRKNRRRYQPFGVAVDKRYAFRCGARPVIYMPWNEALGLLDARELWRVVALDMTRTPAMDWSFEREWRLAGDLVIEPKSTVALVETWRDADELFEQFGGKPPCAGVLPLADLFGSRPR
jgi:hypothetical protein